MVDFSLERRDLVVVFFLHFAHLLLDQDFLVKQFGAQLSHLALNKKDFFNTSGNFLNFLPSAKIVQKSSLVIKREHKGSPSTIPPSLGSRVE